MQSGTILFSGTNLGLYGRPRFTIRKTAEPAPPQAPTHWRVAVTVSLSLSAEMPATVWARARKIAELLDKGQEGTLEVRDENGTALSWQARPADHGSLTDAIKRKRGEVEITFTARQALGTAGDKVHATIDTLDGEDDLVLDRIMSWAENVRPVRPDSRLGNRTEIAESINFTARATYADAALGVAARAEALISAKQAFERAAAREVALTFAGETRTVQVEGITATPSEGWEYLTVEMQARRVVLPDAAIAEVTFEAAENEDPATGETRISLSGTIEADDRGIAVAKFEAILAAWRTPGTRVVSLRKTDTWLDGADTAEEEEPAWGGISFQIELSRKTSATRYTLQIADHEGADGRRVTYSGSTAADTLEHLLATVETAAGGKHPVEISSETTISYATDDEGTANLVNATFSREYALAATLLRGSVEMLTSRSPLGQWVTTVSGSMSAPSAATARAHARAFIPAGTILRTDDEREGSALHNATPGTPGAVVSSFTTIQFTYSWGVNHVSLTGITYTDLTAPDYGAMTEERTISGQCHAPSKSAAQEKVAALLTALSLANPVKSSFTHAHERQHHTSPEPDGITIDRWLHFDFSHTFIGAISGEVGHDIIRAEWSIERVGQVNHKPMTEVPLEKPVEQAANGYNIGTLTATGTCQARLQATARTWGQGKRTAVATTGGFTGAEDPPRERMQVTNVPFQGAAPAFYEFSFTYSFRYRDGLTGLWPSSGLTL